MQSGLCAPGSRDARNPLQIRRELNVDKSSVREQRLDSIPLPVPNFERNETVLHKRIERLRNQPPVNTQSVLVGKQSNPGLKIADLNRKGTAIPYRNVRRIGNDDLKSFPGNRRQQI